MRVSILHELLTGGPARTSALAAQLSVKQPDISAHLALLRQRGLTRQEGNQRSAHEIVDRRTTAELLRAAAAITSARFGDDASKKLQRELRKFAESDSDS